MIEEMKHENEPAFAPLPTQRKFSVYVTPISLGFQTQKVTKEDKMIYVLGQNPYPVRSSKSFETLHSRSTSMRDTDIRSHYRSPATWMGRGRIPWSVLNKI